MPGRGLLFLLHLRPRMQERPRLELERERIGADWRVSWDLEEQSQGTLPGRD